MNIYINKKVIGFIILYFLLENFFVFAEDMKEKSQSTKQLEIKRIIENRKQTISNRKLVYYTVKLSMLEIEPREKESINSGEVIIQGKPLFVPYDIRCDNKTITINKIPIEPRAEYTGFAESFRITEGMQKRSDVAQAIADKKQLLYKEYGDYSLVMPRLAAFAKTFDLVENVKVEGDSVVVIFRSEGPGIAPQEVAYICRKTREGLSGKEKEALRVNVLHEEYNKICACLRDGGCVFIPTNGDIKCLKGGGIKKVDSIITKNQNLNIQLKEYQKILDSLIELFSNSISEEDAAAVVANWTFDNRGQKKVSDSITH